jgi:hypothetical protein
MAATYTLHVAPHAAPGDSASLERAELVRDGFSWGAFLLPVIWYAWHRHWLAAVAAFLITLVVVAVLRAAGFGTGTILSVLVLLHLLNGLEGASVRRWLYARAGRPAMDVVQADSAEEAELKSFGRWLALAERPRRDPAFAPLAFRQDHQPVIGLFPDAEGRA